MHVLWSLVAVPILLERVVRKIYVKWVLVELLVLYMYDAVCSYYHAVA